MSKNFIIGELFMAALKREGLITNEQYMHTSEVRIIAKAGEVVRMELITYLSGDQCDEIARNLVLATTVEKAGKP